jgi:hypothetical protein
MWYSVLQGKAFACYVSMAWTPMEYVTLQSLCGDCLILVIMVRVNRWLTTADG